MPTTAPKADANFTQQFDAIAPLLAGWRMPWIESLRRDAYARLQKVGYPTARTEDWRFTNVNPLIEKDYSLSTKPEDAGVDLASLGFADSIAGSRLVFVNGLVSSRLSKVGKLPKGVQASSLSQALANDGSSDAATVLEAHLGRYADSERLAFTAQNTAFFQDGALIVVPDHAVVEEPIHLVFANTANVASTPRNLIVVGKNAQVTIVEWHLGAPGLTNFSNTVTEVAADEHSHVDHVKLQRESPAAYHLANMQVVLQAKANFTTHYIGLGGSLVRSEVRVRFAGEHAEATVNGLYMGEAKQHLDNHTVIDHAVPNCASHELYKGVLDGSSQGVFNGKIFVRKDAQKTDAKQTNKVLLLSEGATINTKPQLEIFADDVKCTHGATVGQLDENQVYYLRSRGIGLEEARRILTFAFANDVVSRIKLEAIRDELERLIVR
jgi:Fe-S cluster assembly protein SufD